MATTLWPAAGEASLCILTLARGPAALLDLRGRVSALHERAAFAWHTPIVDQGGHLTPMGPFAIAVKGRCDPMASGYPSLPSGKLLFQQSAMISHAPSRRHTRMYFPR